MNALPSPLPEWNIRAEDFGALRPTYADHSQPLERMRETAAAVGESYPHFHAVLTPERYFLHGLMVAMVSRVSMPSREVFLPRVELLYKEYITRFSGIYQRERPRIEQQMADMRDMAQHFLGRAPLPERLQAAYTKWQQHFEQTQTLIQDRIAHGDYRPGEHDASLDDLASVFCQIHVDDVERRANQQFARRWANRLVLQEIRRDRWPALSAAEEDSRRVHAFVGVIGGGKSYYADDALSRAERTRNTYAVIDQDHWKECGLLVEQGSQGWDIRSHDETHLIRRAMLDELDRLAQRDEAPNVMIHVSQLSPRMRQWLLDYGAYLTLELVHCDPGKALKNGLHRHQRGGRIMLTEETLTSVKSLAEAVEFYLTDRSWDAEGDVIIRLRDTTETEHGSHRAQARRKFNTVFVSSEERLMIGDIKGLFNVLRATQINPKATSPETLYSGPHSDADIASRVRPLLEHPALAFYMLRQRDGRKDEEWVGDSILHEPFAWRNLRTREGEVVIWQNRGDLDDFRNFLRTGNMIGMDPELLRECEQGVVLDGRLADAAMDESILMFDPNYPKTGEYQQAVTILRLLDPECVERQALLAKRRQAYLQHDSGLSIVLKELYRKNKVADTEYIGANNLFL